MSSTMLLIYKRNRIGPSIEPCGIPFLTEMPRNTGIGQKQLLESEISKSIMIKIHLKF